MTWIMSYLGYFIVTPVNVVFHFYHTLCNMTTYYCKESSLVSISKQVQSALVISTSVISNNRLSRRENLVPVLTQKSSQVTKYCGKEEKLLLWSNFSPFPQYF